VSLCPPNRCGCAVRSSSLQVTGLPGGGGWNLETYEGVATEVPDTRPPAGVRTNGMRVYTTDTKRLFLWDEPSGRWRILSEPVQTNLTAADFPVRQGAATPAMRLDYVAYQRTWNSYWLKAHLTCLGSGQGNNGVVIGVPSSLALSSHYPAVGPVLVYISSIGAVYPGVIGPWSATEFVIYLADDTTSGAWGVNALAPNDTVQFQLTGVTA
jgi:hypothetical protein